ncbi:MAG: FAD-dependent oxidoreductase, partial [Xanthomonadales bacterium]|nr:FAD-dependent oxidoreductase [Xanthomonadales bacterium]
MKSRDRYLGMNRSISRRDLIQGLGALAVAPLLPGQALADAVLAAEQNPGSYPPALTGLRGNQRGSFEVAHALSLEGKADWGTPGEPDPDIYDLVVVGAGISGLAAAHFFRKEQPHARILILDNHDDFGGHAKRNEFTIDGDTILGYGGSQSLEEPFHYPDAAKELLADLGVNLAAFKNAYDGDFYKRNNLTGGVFFNQKDWGENRLIPYDLATMHSYLPLAPSKLSDSEAIAQMPMSELARVEFLRLQKAREDNLVDLSADEKAMYLQTISYRDYLSKHLGISEPEIFAVLKDLTTDSGVDFGTASAGMALQYLFLPGFQAAGLDSFDANEPYI